MEHQSSIIDSQVEALLQADSPSKEKKQPFLRRLFSSKRRFVGVLMAVLVILFLLFAIGTRGSRSLPEVQTALLSKGNLTETLTVTGPIDGSESVDITSSLHAKLTELNVKEGDRVKKGITVLARIDDEELRREVAIAEGNYKLQIATKEDRLRQERADYGKALQARDTAQLDYDRKSALYSVGGIALSELEASRNALADANRELSLYRLRNGAPVLSDSFDIQIENAKQELEKLKTRLDGAVLIAPIDGTVTRVNAKVGRFADDTEDKKPLITIENLEQLQMELLVSEYNIGKVRVGQDVSIRADILGKGNTVSGKVSGISPSGEKRSYDSSERVIPVKIQITDHNSKLISGITGKAEIVLGKAEQVDVVPLSAVGTDKDGNDIMQFVLTKTGGHSLVQSFPIETGIEGDMEIELKKNPLDALDTAYEPRYLTTYNSDLADGTEVRIAPEEAKQNGN